jgi:hypothetical protein
VAVSEQVKRDLIGYGVASANKITVIPSGSTWSRFLTRAVGAANSAVKWLSRPTPN